MSEACPFCDLSAEKQRVVKIGKLSSVILSNPRLMPGHTLVMPNRHIEEPWELTDAELLAIFDDIKFVQRSLLKAIATGCDVRQNYRPFLPQGRLKVNHVHYHVQPRSLEDELYDKSQRFEPGLFRPLEPDEQQEIMALFTEE